MLTIAWTRMTAIPPRASPGRRLDASCLTQKIESEFTENGRSAADKQQPPQTEYRIQKVDNNQVISVFTQTVPERGENGEIIGYVGTITNDISDREHGRKTS